MLTRRGLRCGCGGACEAIMTREQILTLAGRTGVSIPSVRKWLAKPSSLIRSVRYALEKGCEELGNDLPEEMQCED